jgi:hypothetical protein
VDEIDPRPDHNGPTIRGGVFMPTTDTQVANVNGIQLGYRVVGQGSPLILLHGGFGTVEMFGPNVELLAAGRQVIGVDLQSHGRSPAADRPMTFELMADDIALPIRSFGLERAAIMGFSLGGEWRSERRSNIRTSSSASCSSRRCSRARAGTRRCELGWTRWVPRRPPS